MVWFCDQNTVDNTGMFQLLLNSDLTASWLFLLLTLPWQWVSWGCTSCWKGTQPGQLTPANQRDISHHVMLWSAIKAEGKRRGRGGEGGEMDTVTFSVMAFVFPSNRYMWRSPVFLRMDEHLPADGRQWMNSLFCFACAHSFFFTY